MGSAALRVDHPLWQPFSIEMLHLLPEVAGITRIGRREIR
jgi:hypothetical protein